MTLKDTIKAARRYHALKKCIKHGLLTYKYGSAFVASSGGLSSLLALAPKLADIAKAKTAMRSSRNEPLEKSNGEQSQ